MKDFKITILGSEWEVLFKDKEEDPTLQEHDGYTDSSIRKIVVETFHTDEYSKKDLESYQKLVIRHEIIHAFLFESGLEGNGSLAEHWELNEEMVDWFAIQSPKIFKTFQEAGVL